MTMSMPAGSYSFVIALLALFGSTADGQSREVSWGGFQNGGQLVVDAGSLPTTWLEMVRIVGKEI